MSAASKPKASFGTARTNISGVLVRAKAMYAAILAAIAMFPSPTITMVAFLALIEALDAAQQAKTTNTRGLASLRNTKRDALWSAMESLRVYVQGLADLQPAENAKALIEAAGLLVASTARHTKDLLKANLTTTPGKVVLVANASLLTEKTTKRVTFHWQLSADGKTWTSVASTPISTTTITNLTLMTEYWFRVSVTVSTETGDWSEPVSLLVH